MTKQVTGRFTWRLCQSKYFISVHVTKLIVLQWHGDLGVRFRIRIELRFSTRCDQLTRLRCGPQYGCEFVVGALRMLSGAFLNLLGYTEILIKSIRPLCLIEISTTCNGVHGVKVLLQLLEVLLAKIYCIVSKWNPQALFDLRVGSNSNLCSHVNNYLCSSFWISRLFAMSGRIRLES